MEQEQEGRLGRAAVIVAALALVASACGRESASGQARVEPERNAGADATALRAELAGARTRIAELEGELQDATAKRVAREEEWVRYTKALTQLSPAADAVEAKFQPIADPNAAPAADAGAAPDDEDEARTKARQSLTRRDREIAVALKTLFTLDQVTGFDLLESGTLGGGFTGPVVLRALDDRGRPVASLVARRLRLEGSRAARTVTLVLEDGFERRAGEKRAFEGPMTEEGRGGARRIEMPETDPTPWIASVPELFRDEDKAPPDYDLRWDLGQTRAALNLLLREDVSGGWWRLVSFGGVRDGVLRDVQLDGLDAQGRLERKLFADRMEISAQERGVRIELLDGAQLRGDSKTPFLDGRYRIFLPRASVEAWTKAGIPGLSEPPDAR
ncbi:MAG TPA: hypothetical protein VGR31_17045 [Planctomycetota bacterium]|nr:hypothetical protein [Planctomycetota bacterium]